MTNSADPDQLASLFTKACHVQQEKGYLHVDWAIKLQIESKGLSAEEIMSSHP